VEKEKPWAITATTEELIEAYGDEIKGWLELQRLYKWWKSQELDVKDTKLKTLIKYRRWLWT